jgi:putative ABC transport system substrate-binding protein
MKRRAFIAGLGSTVVWPVVARGQHERVRRIGMLMLVGEDDKQAHAERAAFTTELQRLGWVEGQSVQIDQRWANGDVSKLQSLAAQLVALSPELLVVQGSAALAALRQATRTLPIIFAEVSDPVGQGFVESLARPGGNTTGFALFEFSMAEKWLDLLKQLKPSTERVGIVSNPATLTAPFGKLYFQSIEAAAPRFAIQPFSIEIDQKTDLERKLADLALDQNSGLIVLLDAFTYVHRDFIIGQTLRHQIPAIYTVTSFAEEGGLAAYGVDLADQFRQAATY